MIQRRNDVQATFYAVEWFLCAYTRTLPWETVLRIWDMFLCEGLLTTLRKKMYKSDLHKTSWLFNFSIFCINVPKSILNCILHLLYVQDLYSNLLKNIWRLNSIYHPQEMFRVNFWLNTHFWTKKGVMSRWGYNWLIRYLSTPVSTSHSP